MDTFRRFTYVGGGSNKFWEIFEPQQVDENQWAVMVRFGRIGQWGQEHTNVFSNKLAARNHYIRKVEEKQRKGYKETGQVSIKKNVVNYYPDYIQAPPKPKPCEHINLTRSGQIWRCSTCGSKVEFEKQSNEPRDSAETVEIVTKVRRFFNLSARQS